MRFRRIRTEITHGRGTRAWFAAAALLLCVSCTPRTGTRADVDRALERGREYRSRHLYDKAEAAFQALLSQHPEDPRAHRELGYLYFQDLNDYVSALYHTERYLGWPDLPRTNNFRDVLLEQVRAMCQQEIAKEVSLSGLTSSLELEIKSLNHSNQVLRQQVANLQDRLNKALAARRHPGTQPAASASRPPSDHSEDPTATPQPQPQSTRQQTQSVQDPSATPLRTRGENPSDPSSRPGAVRYHTVRRGDTFFSLARAYGVSVQALSRANPEVRHDNLQIGYRLKIPAQ